MTELDAFDWAFRIQEPIQVDARKNGSEWQSRLFERISKTTGCDVIDMKLVEPHGDVYTLIGSSVTSSLLIAAPEENQPVCYVLGNGEITPEKTDPWTEAISFAVRQLGDTEEFSWWAVISEDPDTSFSPRLKLADSAKVSGVELQSNPTCVFEARSEADIYQFNTSYTHPVLAHGTALGYEWPVAAGAATGELKILCSLLSIATRRIWRLRKPPNQLRHDPVAALPSLPEYSSTYPDYLKGTRETEDPELFRVPEWVTSAREKLRRDPELTQLVATFHESLLLASRHHDSYGLIAVVAIVEAIGNKGIKKRKLPKCEKCKLITGSTERFLTALKRVMSESEAESLTKIVYNQRSLTAHNGQLHGTEFIVGSYPGFWSMSDNPIETFEYTTRRLRGAANELLRQELTAE